MSVRAMMHRRGGTSIGSQAHGMDDKLDQGGHNAGTGIATSSLVVRTRCASSTATPVRLVNVVLRALRREVKKRYQLSAMEAGQHVEEPDVWLTSVEDYELIYDAITGARLDPSSVAKARNAEMSFWVDQLGACKYHRGHKKKVTERYSLVN